MLHVHTLLTTNISQPAFFSRWFSFSRFNVDQKSGVIVTSLWANFLWYTTIKSRWRSPLPFVYHGPENYLPPCWEWWSPSILSLRCTLPETNSSPLKMDGWNTILSYWGGLCEMLVSGHLKLQGDTPPPTAPPRAEGSACQTKRCPESPPQCCWRLAVFWVPRVDQNVRG